MNHTYEVPIPQKSEISMYLDVLQERVGAVDESVRQGIRAEQAQHLRNRLDKTLAILEATAIAIERETKAELGMLEPDQIRLTGRMLASMHRAIEQAGNHLYEPDLVDTASRPARKQSLFRRVLTELEIGLEAMQRLNDRAESRTPGR